MGNCMKRSSATKKQSQTQSQRQEPIKLHQPTEQDLTIAKLKDLRDDLYQKQQVLYKQEEKSEQEIKQLLKENKKQRAKFAIIQVEKTIMDKNLNEVMEQTNNFLKDIQKTMNMDVFSEAMEVDAALQEQEQQFQQLFDQYNVGDVDKEYEKYEAEILQNQFNQENFNQVPFQPINNQNQMEIEQQPHQSYQQEQHQYQEEEMLVN